MKKIFTLLFALLSINALSFGQIINNSDSSLTDEDGDGERNDHNTTQCGGVERWSVKVLTDPAVNTINFTPINTTINNLVNLTTPTPSTTMPRYAGVEDKTYSVTCNITIKKVETDNDYHLVLSDGTHTMIAEVPDPNCSAASTSAYVNNFIAVRNWVDAHIASGNVFNVNIPPVTVTGVAFVDPPHNQTGAAPNNLELHSMLSIAFANMTGVNDTNLTILKASVFPNPIADNFQVEVRSKINQLNVCTFQLFGIDGKKCYEKPLTVLNNNLIDCTLQKGNLAKGFYIYRITNDGKPLYEGKIGVID